jgi:hypothetical protein
VSIKWVSDKPDPSKRELVCNPQPDCWHRPCSVFQSHLPQKGQKEKIMVNAGIPVVVIPAIVALIIWVFMAAWHRAWLRSGGVGGRKNLSNMISNIIAFLFVLVMLDIVGMQPSSNSNDIWSALAAHTIWNAQFLLKCLLHPLSPISIGR